MKNIKIGIFGLNYESNNFGCAALAYSFLSIITELIEETDDHFELTFFDSVKSSLTKPLDIKHDKIDFDIFLYDKHNIRALRKKIKEEDLFFDFTAGDSFTDYYGLGRFVKRTFNKTLVITGGKKLILGPQTIGPFLRPVAKKWAKFVIKRSFKVYARDGASKKRAEEICGKKDISLVTDVAFALTYDKEKYRELTGSDKKKLGINFSGLLYCGGYTGDNQFGLTVDYKKYCTDLLEALKDKTGEYDIWLIPHVVSATEGFADNDLIPTKELKERYPFLKVAPLFTDPVDAKSFISQMDIFTGARMHATIAAFSSGVVTIPFSYSVKFEGLYGELGYDRCINGKELSTDEAVGTTVKYIGEAEKLKEEQSIALKEAHEKLAVFKDDVREMMREL